jgi:16S rRNA (adenine1518-N6/adenine1519-N6)-dimethyltransferase
MESRVSITCRWISRFRSRQVGVSSVVNHKEIKSRLESLEINPSKGMGQNYLADDESARAIADAIRPEVAPVVMEIGPGLGAVTEHLLGRCQRLVLIELERRVADWWKNRCADRPEVEVHHADASRFDLRPWYQHGPLHVVGNLPYSVAGEIMRHFLSAPTPVAEAVFMVQKEVAERLTAQAHSSDYGLLTLRVAHRWHVEIIREVPPESFHPRPRVDSSVVRFTPRDPASLPVFDKIWFDDLAKRGFSQRRKQLKNLLPDTGDWLKIANDLGFSPMARAQELDLHQWIELSRLLHPRPGETSAQSAEEWFDVVDEENRVQRQVTRGEVHAQGLRHRATHIFAFNQKGELLLQKRSHLKDVAPLKWDSSASGHLDVGESYEDAAARELSEELGLRRIPALSVIADLPAKESTGWEFVRLFGANVDAEPRYPAGEVDCVGWFEPDTVAAWIQERPEDFAPGFIECFRLWDMNRLLAIPTRHSP